MKPLSWFKRHWRAIELANHRSPKSGRPLRRPFTGEVHFDPPTREQWAALAHYRKLTCKTRRVDHETAYLSAYGESDPQSMAIMQSLQRSGLLVVDYSQQR